MTNIYSSNKISIRYNLPNELDSSSFEKPGREALQTAASIDQQDHVLRTPYPRVIPGPPSHVEVYLWKSSWGYY